MRKSRGDVTHDLVSLQSATVKGMQGISKKKHPRVLHERSKLWLKSISCSFGHAIHRNRKWSITQDNFWYTLLVLRIYRFLLESWDCAKATEDLIFSVCRTLWNPSLALRKKFVLNAKEGFHNVLHMLIHSRIHLSMILWSFATQLRDPTWWSLLNLHPSSLRQALNVWRNALTKERYD